MGADDIEENIVINGDASGGVEAVDSTTQAFDRFIEKHGELKSVFEQRFEHAGLYLFSRQVLGLAGLGDVARHTMGVFTLGLQELASAAGIATATVAPWLLAAGAAIIVAEKLYKANHDAADSYANLAQTQDQKLARTIADAQTQERADRAQIASLESLRREQMGYMASTEEGSIMHNRAVNAANDLSMKIALLRDNMAAEHDIAQQGIKDLHARALGYSDEADMIHKRDEASRQAAEKQKKSALQALSLAEQQAHAEIKHYEKMQEIDAQEAKRKDAAITKEMQFFGLSSTGAEDLERVESHTFQSMADGAGQALGKMVVEGKNFDQSMKQVFKSVEESFISDVSSMMIKWAAFQAVTSMGFGPAAAAGVGGGGLFSMHATGADYIVDRPTPFIAGEGGMERVTVTPMAGGGGGSSSSGGGGSGGGSTTVNITVNAQTNADPNAIGQAVLKAIRGQGQLQFVRTS